MSNSTEIGNFMIGKFLETDTDQTNQIQINLSKEKNDESKEDLVSEAGTYTIDEKTDGKENQENVSNQLPFKSIDLMSARAAIDETFGIVDRPDITNDKQEAPVSPTQGSKRLPQKMARERNLTYSLNHDFVNQLKIQNDDGGKDINQGDSSFNETAPLTKTKTYDIIAHNQDLLVNTTSGNNDDCQSQSTINAVPISQSLDLDTQTSQVSSTKSAVNTELLLGKTETLIESIKKRASDKKLALQKRLNNANNLIKDSSTTKPLSPSSSSSCSSSTMSIEKTDRRSWTIPTTGDDNCDSDTSTGVHMEKRGNGGMAFEFIMNDDSNKNSPVTKPSKPTRLTSANLARHRSAAARDNPNSHQQQKPNQLQNSSSFSTASSNKTASRSKHASITRNYNRNVSRSDDVETGTNVSGSVTQKSGTSLGAKIQARASAGQPTKSGETRRASVSRRASDNSFQSMNSSVNSATSNNSSSMASPYTNRTLYLRQQSALAKRDSLNNSNDKKPLNGILKKAPSRQQSRANSRNTSPYNCNGNVPAHQSPLMTGSLNLPKGSSLPGQDLYQRRKNYDPRKAVELDKQNKLANSRSQLQSSTSRNSIGSNIEYDSMSEASSSFSMPMQPNSNPHSNSNKQSYEKILQSTLQRLCIRLIQMSTGVLDKIGDENGSNSEANLLSAMESASELERMQQLAKLVHSMQLVHDHIQIIDSSLSNNPKPEDQYMKELSKIRQEVETLKQSAVNNSSANSSIDNN